MNETLPLDDETDLSRPWTAAEGISRGVCRLLTDMGCAVLCEFKLTSRRRVDVMGLTGAGQFLAVEVKSSVADFRADSKWPEYLPFCDRFYFAVTTDFPVDILPTGHGLIIADAWQAAVQRPAPLTPMNGNRRRNQTLRFARLGARRLQGLIDPPA